MQAPLAAEAQFQNQPANHQISINSLQTGTPVKMPFVLPLPNDGLGSLDIDGSLEHTLQLSARPGHASMDGRQPESREEILRPLLSPSSAMNSPVSMIGGSAGSHDTSGHFPARSKSEPSLAFQALEHRLPGEADL